MKPYCSRCFSKESDPVETDTGIEVHWFTLDEEGEAVTLGLDEGGEIGFMFTGIVGEDFDYDESQPLLCSDCVVSMYDEYKELEEPELPDDEN
jgi:hypothetical protein